MEDTRLDSLAQKVIADFRLPGPARPRFEYVLDKDNPQFAQILVEVEEESVFGFGVDQGASDAKIMVQIAEGLQDNLPELHATWGVALPECPGHTHPMYPQEKGNEAWWVCPKDGRRVKLVGTRMHDGPLF